MSTFRQSFWDFWASAASSRQRHKVSRRTARDPSSSAGLRARQFFRSARYEALEPRAMLAVVIGATKVDSLSTDLGVSGQANPGDTIQYDIAITNSGDTDATNVAFTDTLDDNTTLVANSINVSPLAFNDSYNAIGNTLLRVGGSAGAGPEVFVSGVSLFNNDVEFTGGDFNPASDQITDAAFIITHINGTAVGSGSQEITTGGGGTLTIITDGADKGTFTYLGAAGFEGTDSFTYTVTDGAFSDTATVSIVVNEVVWYVDDATGSDSTGTGRSNAPFQSLAPINTGGAFDTTDNADDYIFVYSGTYSGGFVLEAGQRLIGEPAGLTVGALTIAASGTRPTLGHNTTSAVALSSNNTIRSMNFTNSAGDGITGSAIGTLVLSDFDVTVTGGSALSVTTSGTITATGADNDLNSTNGTALNVANTTIGAAGLTFKSISAGAGANNGITLNTTGALGGLIVTGTGAAGSGGTISNTTADAITLTSTVNVRLNDMIIGDSTAIDTQTADTINNIGGHGIVITSVTPGPGTYGLSLDNVKIARTGGHGINGSGGGNVGLGVTNSMILNAGDAAPEDAINFGSGFPTTDQITGTVLLQNSTFAAMVDHGFQVENAGSGVLNMTVNNVTFKNNDTIGIKNEGSAIQIIADGSDIAGGTGPTANLTVTQLTATNIDQDVLDLIADPGGNINVTVGDPLNAATNGITANNPNGDNVLRFASGSPDTDDNATFTFDVRNVIVQQMAGTLVQFTAANTMSGKFLNSTLDANGLGNLLAARGIEILADGDNSEVPAMTILVENVTLNRIGGDGIQVLLREVISSSSRMDVTFRNNNIGTNPANLAQTGLEIGQNTAGANEGIEVRNGVTGSANGQMYINIDGNNIRTASTSASAEGIDLDAEQSSLTHATVKRNNVLAAPGTADYRFDTEAAGATLFLDFGTDDGSGDGANLGVDAILTRIAGTFNVEGGTGALAGNNPGLSITTSGTFGTGTAIMPNEPLFLAPSDEPAAPADGGILPSAELGSLVGAATTTQPPTQVNDGILSSAELASLVAAAIERWAATGLSTEQIDLLQSVVFSVEQLPGQYLGAAGDGAVTLDADAAGKGWFVDATPLDDAEFTRAVSATRSYADSSAAPAGHVDLLTTIMHEMGHVLGLEDSYAAAYRESVMYGYVTPGERRLAAIGQAEGATPSGDSHGMDFVLVPVFSGITLTAGTTVRVRLQATIDDPFPSGPAQVSNQGTVEFEDPTTVGPDGPVLTDDPDVGGTADPTVTPVVILDSPDVTVAVAPSSVTEDGGTNLVYTFTRPGSTANALTVNFSVGGTAAFGDDYSQSGAATYSTTSGTVTFAAGSSTAVVTLDPATDPTVESDETAILTVMPGSGYDVGASNTATGTIENDDTEVSVAVTPSSVAEDGAANLDYTFTRPGDTATALTVSFSVGGDADFTTDYTQSGADTFTATSGTVTFAAGSSTANVTLDPAADTMVEADETATLAIQPGAGYTAAGSTAATGIITNDDMATYTINDVTVNESAGTLTFVVSVNNPVDIPVTITVNYTDVTTSAGDFDHSADTVTFPANSTATQAVTVAITNDTLVEGTETFTASLSTTTTDRSLNTSDTATGTIANDDAAAFSIANVAATEGDFGLTNMVFTVTLSNGVQGGATVNFNTMDGTATSTAGPSQDFNFASGTLSFSGNAGETKTITVQVQGDLVNEPNETFTVALSSPNAVDPAVNDLALSAGGATGTILNDDGAGESRKITGGGTIANQRTFGFNAQPKNGTFKGNLEFHDNAGGIHVQSTSITFVGATATHGTFTGVATVNGVGGRLFKVTVDDLGEPGNNDTFRLQLDTGYDTGISTLTGGNIQIHKVSNLVTGAPSSGSAPGDDPLLYSAGQLLIGVLTVSLQNASGTFTPAQHARVLDALDVLNDSLGSFGVALEVTTDSIAADVRLEIAANSASGGMADGVLGSTSGLGDITIIQGWNWYAGADAGAIGAGQYDFQTVVTHELGHTVGLGHSTDTNSVMYESLSAGGVRRTLTEADLTIGGDDGGGPAALRIRVEEAATLSTPAISDTRVLEQVFSQPWQLSQAGDPGRTLDGIVGNCESFLRRGGIDFEAHDLALSTDSADVFDVNALRRDIAGGPEPVSVLHPRSYGDTEESPADATEDWMLFHQDGGHEDADVAKATNAGRLRRRASF